MFLPMRIFQHQEGRILCRADRGHELECWALFLVHLSQTDALPDSLTKILVCHNKIYNSSLMHKILVYLHIIHLLKYSTCFEHYPAHLPEVYVITVYMQPLVSVLSAGDCLVHKTVTCREYRYQRLHIYNYDIDLLKMSRVMLQTCRVF